jgi:spoIIIJ-associated protein
VAGTSDKPPVLIQEKIQIMPIADKIASARQIESLLKTVIQNAGFRLRYRITIDPPIADDRNWEKPEIFVELSGPDSELILSRNAELLRSIELLTLESLNLRHDEHDKVIFDCMNHRSSRIEELKLASKVAADRVRETGRPYQFGPMSSRERRIVHLALRDYEDLKTESEGMGHDRRVVVFPKDYKPSSRPAPSFRRRR